jgi:hypothetical protein
MAKKLRACQVLRWERVSCACRMGRGSPSPGHHSPPSAPAATRPGTASSGSPFAALYEMPWGPGRWGDAGSTTGSLPGRDAPRGAERALRCRDRPVGSGGSHERAGSANPGKAALPFRLISGMIAWQTCPCHRPRSPADRLKGLGEERAPGPFVSLRIANLPLAPLLPGVAGRPTKAHQVRRRTPHHSRRWPVPEDAVDANSLSIQAGRKGPPRTLACLLRLDATVEGNGRDEHHSERERDHSTKDDTTDVNVLCRPYISA